MRLLVGLDLDSSKGAEGKDDQGDPELPTKIFLGFSSEDVTLIWPVVWPEEESNSAGEEVSSNE